jgi:hypothetical protein
MGDNVRVMEALIGKESRDGAQQAGTGFMGASAHCAGGFLTLEQRCPLVLLLRLSFSQQRQYRATVVATLGSRSTFLSQFKSRSGDPRATVRSGPRRVMTADVLLIL